MTPDSLPHARRGLFAVFGSTLFQLSGLFMLSPLLLLMLKKAGVSTTVAGLFAATTWLGIFIVTPFASTITQRLGRRASMWLASGLPLLAAVGFLATRNLWLWFVLELVAGVAGGMRWVLAEAFIAEFSPAHKIGRYVGTYATMVGLTFVIGPTLLARVGSESPWALWIVIGLMGLGLAWTALIPSLPADHDALTAQVGLRGIWQAVWLHPVVMLAGFVGGFFELGLASILPLYGLTLGLSASTSALLVSVSGLGGMLVALPAGMVADQFASPAAGRRLLMQVCAFLLLLAAGASLWVMALAWVIWPVVAVWGAAGGALYTLVMVDIGAREKGLTLVNSTAVLVLTYTLGGLAASGVSGALLDQSPTLGFPMLLIGVAAAGLAVLTRCAPPTPML